MSKRKRIHRSYPRYISNKPTCDDCGIPETMCVETDINGTYLSPPNLLFSIPSFELDGVSMVPELNPLGELLDPQVLSFPNNELDNFDILEYSINIIEPVFKYTIRFTMSWRDSSQPQLANENYDSWVKRTSISFSNTHTQETPCAINDSVRTTLPANTIISGIINKSEIQAANEERIKRYFSSGLLGSPESIDISIRLSSEQHETCTHCKKRCFHSIIYRGGTSECESPCRLVSAYSGVNGMGEIVSGSSGNCIVATSGLCASISGVWESAYCCPSPSPSVSPSPSPSPSVSPSPSPSPSVSPTPTPTLVATFNMDGYGTGVYGGSGVHSALNCVQVSDSLFFDDQYVYQLSMDNAGMVTYEYEIVGGMTGSFVISSGDNKLFFYDSEVGVSSGAVYSVIVRASDTANSAPDIDTEVFIPICSG